MVCGKVSASALRDSWLDSTEEQQRNRAWCMLNPSGSNDLPLVRHGILERRGSAQVSSLSSGHPSRGFNEYVNEKSPDKLTGYRFPGGHGNGVG
ncbi:hypothetical protein AVEN_257585-1 [Araneus ventricosus]|uniref:Uncharacterized protein n=1 Tax=Araneus ventricosus TaxID=182803 RepID=A0A4Y2NS26_ARAVE|nr:hypothetical protein AVEN_257585-1 [Araneus ventricosus]